MRLEVPHKNLDLLRQERLTLRDQRSSAEIDDPGQSAVDHRGDLTTTDARVDPFSGADI